MPGALKIGTRGSALALAQSGMLVEELRLHHPYLDIELVVIRTQGDKDSVSPLSQAGGSGLFTKEIEEALLRSEIDAAIHSLKDLPTQLQPGLVLAAVTTREDWRDAWLSPSGLGLLALPRGSKVGTGSPRRRAQLARRRPDLEYVEFRGNVDTRLRKLNEGQAAAAVLAAAGLARLGRLKEAAALLGEEEMLPAPGQGFLAVEARQGDAPALSILRALDDPSAHACSDAERAFLDRLGAGCHVPVAALARTDGAKLRLRGFTQNKDSKIYEGTMDGELKAGSDLGIKLAESLLAQGAEMTR